jgi:glutaredoxin
MLEVYSKEQCPYCDMAKQLLDKYEIPYTVIKVDEDDAARDFLVWQGLRSVPQIFHEGELIKGGFQGLKAIEHELVERFVTQHITTETEEENADL